MNVHDTCQIAADGQLPSLLISVVSGRHFKWGASGLVLVLALFTLFASFVHEARTSEVAPDVKFQALANASGGWANPLAASFCSRRMRTCVILGRAS